MLLNKTISAIYDSHPDLSEEHIELIIKSFHDGMRYYCTHPTECKNGILLNGLMKINMNTRKVRSFLEAMKVKESTLGTEEFEKYKQTKNFKSFSEYEEILQLQQEYERQEKKQVFNERFIK